MFFIFLWDNGGSLWPETGYWLDVLAFHMVLEAWETQLVSCSRVQNWCDHHYSLLWVWQSAGTGCPEQLWSLHLWRYSKPTWMRSCAACSRQRGWTRWSQEVPSNSYHSVILWFCDQIWSQKVCHPQPDWQWTLPSCFWFSSFLFDIDHDSFHRIT